MQRKKQLIIGRLVTLLLLFSIGGWRMLEKQHLQERMIEEVKSRDAQKEYLELLQNIDKYAFSEKGIIQSYEIDETSIRHNPMGGIFVTLVINKNKNFIITYVLNKDSHTDKFLPGSSSMSQELVKALKERDGENKLH